VVGIMGIKNVRMSRKYSSDEEWQAIEEIINKKKGPKRSRAT